VLALILLAADLLNDVRHVAKPCLRVEVRVELLQPEELEQVRTETLVELRRYERGVQLDFTVDVVLASGVR